MRAVQIRRERERAPVRDFGAVEVAVELACGAEVVEVTRVAGIESDGALEQRNGVGVIAGAAQHHAERVECQCIARRETDARCAPSRRASNRRFSATKQRARWA